MKTKDGAKVFDVRLSRPKPYLCGGKEYTSRVNVLVIAVTETASRAIELALAEYPDGTVWQVIHHGGQSKVVVDDSQIISS